MFQRALAIGLLILMMLSNFSKVVIYGSFELNRDYIATALCENKDKPQLHCEGKCYLMKKLKDAEEKEKKQEEATQKKIGLDSFVVNEPLFVIFYYTAPKKATSTSLSFKLPKISTEILHPPPAESSVS